jgi:hypothetical protein
MLRHASLNDTVYYWFGLNSTAGAGDDGASPTFAVRLGGASSSGAPTYTGTPTLLTHATYTPGSYEIEVPATAGNGFAAAGSYGVFCSALVSSVNPTGYVGGLNLSPVLANVTQLGSDAQSATDLKDFADAGYDPATNKVQGVVLVDSTTEIATNGITATSLSSGAMTDIYVAVWDAPLAGFATPGTAGKTLADLSSTTYTVQDIVDGVWDESNASHVTTGTTGANLNAAGAGTDPWSIALPGAYTAGMAGYILGTNLNALITSRMATYVQPTGFLAATFPATVASTTNITAGTITTATNVTTISANGITATSLSAGSLTDIAGAVWDATMADYVDAGSTGFTLNAAGSAGDPWSIALPGVYAAGTAGYLVGTYLDAAVSAIPANVLAEFQGDIIPVNVKQVNDINVIGSGLTVDPWGPQP